MVKSKRFHYSSFFLPKFVGFLFLIYIHNISVCIVVSGLLRLARRYRMLLHVDKLTRKMSNTKAKYSDPVKKRMRRVSCISLSLLNCIVVVIIAAVFAVLAHIGQTSTYLLDH